MHLYPREKSVITLNSLLEIDDLTSCTSFLDFGGNKGNLLTFAEFTVPPANYTCIDVDSEALEIGQIVGNDSTFIHYNRYSKIYNPSGNLNEPFPDIDKNQDIIFAFSVFTHTDFTEFKQAVDWFKTFNYKKIIISLLGVNSTSLLNHFYTKRVDHYGESVDIREFENESGLNIAYLTDNNVVEKNAETSVHTEPCRTFLTFYNLDWVVEQLGGTIQVVHEMEYPFLVITPETA